MNPTAFQHQAISASAGTGKTYALAHRYIALVQHGVPPDRICALTFSRKAAGEIFDEIIRHLCDSASHANAASASSKEIGLPLQPADFANALRRVVDHLHRLHIGTIDSFVVGVVRAFPFELGISPDFRVGNSDGAAGDEIRRTLFGRLFDPALTSESDRQAFLESFKLATFGQEHKSLGQTLERFITELAGIHRRISSSHAWGEPQTIWHDVIPWPRLSATERAAQATTALQHAWTDTAAEQYAETIAFLRDYDDQREWSKKVEDRVLFARLWQVLTAPAGEAFAVKSGRKELLLPAPAADALRQLVQHVMAVELDRTLRQTHGVAALLTQYENLYAEHMRRSGQLGFDDLARLVSGDTGFSPSGTPGKIDHLFINYRLDSVLDHWLLDEFQDTSDLQWQVLGNLIDETVQDDSGTRSFFYVGDVKQAIYGWRGGNHRLFGEVKDRYGEAIASIHRDVSFRSAPVVIDALNDIFGTLSEDDHLPSQTLAEWHKIWRPHAAARKNLPGSVELLEAVATDDESASDARYRAIATRLSDIAPVQRGLQAAVLLRTNDQARRCADVLRTHLPNAPVALEGQAALLDNPLVPLMLSLIRFAAHPGDELAWQHLQMSPLHETVGQSDGGTVKRLNGQTVRQSDGETVEQSDGPTVQPSNRPTASTRSSLSLSLLTAIHRDGFQPTLRDGCARLETAQPFDTFTRLRRDDLLDAAAAFDATNNRDCDQFIRFVEGYTRHDTASETAIRVMTIHQSKGLGFDLVCVPFDPKAESFDNPNNDDMLEEAHGQWVLKSPRKMVVESDAILNATANQQMADAAFAKLCVFYVALTRAKQGLLLVVSPAPKESTVVREDTLLRTRFAVGQLDSRTVGRSDGSTVQPISPPPANLYHAGDPSWHTRHELLPIAATITAASAPAILPPGTPRLKRIEPSKQDPGTRPAAACFKREAGDVRVFGSAIHRLFQQIEWIETFDVDQALKTWRATATEPAAVLRDVEQQFRTSLNTTEVRQALRRPAGDAILWREKPFELLHEGQLLAGQFDRVVIEYAPQPLSLTTEVDRTGRRASPRAADVRQVSLFDFKSNRVESEPALKFAAEHYREQMALYTAALRHILGPAPITTQLIFTRIGRVVSAGQRLPFFL